MRRNGLIMDDLAEKAQVSKQFISLILLGRRRCNPSVAAAIADALHQPVDRLFMSVLSDSSNNEAPVMSVIEIDDPYLNFEDVAALARMEPKTLRHYRHEGKGPEFFLMGNRLKIRRSKALAWIARYELGEDATEDATES